MNIVKKLIVALFIISSAGCAYQLTTKPTPVKTKKFEYVLPANWVRSTMRCNATKHGYLLEEFFVDSFRVKSKLPRTKVILSASDINEQYKLILSEYEIFRGCTDFKTTDTADVKVDGQDAKKVQFEYSDLGGLLYKGEIYIVTYDDFTYMIVFEAPKKYYYEKYSGMLDEVVSSFTFKKK